MKVELWGDAMGRWSYRSSFLRHPSGKFLAQIGKTFYFCFFLPGGDSCSDPQRSRARVFVARRSEPLTARTAAHPSAREEKACSEAREEISTRGRFDHEG